MSVLDRVRRAESTSGIASPTPLRYAELKRSVKQEMLERVGYDEVSRMAAAVSPERSREELRPAIEAVLNARATGPLTAQEQARIVREVLDDVVGLGPLQELLDDDGVSEIMVNGCASTFYERAGKLYPMHDVFADDEQIRVIIDRIISPLGRRIDERSPIVNARLPSGYRVNAVIPPIAIDGPVLTIRKFSDRITSLGELVGLGSLPSWYAQLLSCAVSLRQDLAVAGGTGSGKTTLLNALSCEIDLGERIVTIEDSVEARQESIEGKGEVSIRQLVANALRMRPDRIVVGEVRGEECIDMLQAMNTGHDGSLTTLHAGTAREVIVRLTLLSRYGIDLPGDLIEEQIAMALDGIVMSQRMPDGRRFVSSFTGVTRAPEGGVQLEEYVSFDPATASWTLLREPPFIAEGVRSGAITREEVERWRALCPREAEYSCA